MKPALILFAHGARDPAWAEPFRAIRERVAVARGDLTVALAYLELMKPGLADCVDALAADGCRRITIAPLFLALGGHLKRDLPRLLDESRARHPGLNLMMLAPIAEVSVLRDAIADWVANATPAATL